MKRYISQIYDLKGKLPTRSLRLTGIFGLAIMVGVFMVQMLPQQVAFSYASATCQPRLTILPALARSNNSSFSATFNRSFLATEICFKPEKVPVQKKYIVSAEPIGISLLSTRYIVTVGNPPKVTAASTSQPIAVTQSVSFKLSSEDKFFAYAIQREGQKSTCKVDGKKIFCGLENLKLPQGSAQTVELWRIYADKSVDRIATQTFEILPAVTIANSAIQQNQIIYGKPSDLIFEADKNLRGTDVTMTYGQEKKLVATTTKVEGKRIILAFSEALLRNESFEVTIARATAEDGSTLAKPYVLNFRTSGGPKVHSVVPQGVVEIGNKLTVEFDQPITVPKEAIDQIRVLGAQTTKLIEANQVTFSVISGNRCGEVTIQIPKGVRGAENDVEMIEAWSHKLRLSCRSSSIIGYTVRGRPIHAYTYGSGATAILFTGGIHGSEPSSVYLLDDWIAHMDENAHKIPAGRKVVIVPSLNPDGIAAGTRNNANGVNLDRNFATSNWTSDITSAGGFVKGGGGSAPNSEPETKAIAAYTAQLRPKLEVSYHAYGSWVGASACSTSAAPARAYAASVGYSTMIGSAEAAMGYAFTGEYEEWMCERLGIPSILIELPGNYGRYFTSHTNTMWKMVNW